MNHGNVSNQTAEPMTPLTQCPVCGLALVNDPSDQCPQCNADLVCFKALNAIPDELPVKPVETRPARRYSSILFGLFVLFMLAVLAGLVLLGVHQYQRIRDLEQTLFTQHRQWTASVSRIKMELDHQIETLNHRMTSLSIEDESKLPIQTITGNNIELSQTAVAVHDQVKSDEKAPLAFTTYTAKADDTLWEIAQRVYGNGKYYPVLLEHNPDVGIYGIGRGVTLKVLKDRDNAQSIYNEIIEETPGGIYWRYRVRDGDTLHSIARRLRKQGQTDGLFPHLNETRLQPGQVIQIRLDAPNPNDHK